MIRPPDFASSPDNDDPVIDDFAAEDTAVEDTADKDLASGDPATDELLDEVRRWLDEEFPLGDGVAEDTSVVMCPYCGEPNEIGLDAGSGEAQEYIEDCQVCCQPWQVVVHYLPDGSADVTVTPADGD